MRLSKCCNRIHFYRPPEWTAKITRMAIANAGKGKPNYPAYPISPKKLLNLLRDSKAFVPAIKPLATSLTLDASQCLAHGGNRRIATLSAENSGTRDKGIGTGGGDFGNIIDGHTAVDFQPNRQAAGVDHGSGLA